MIHISNYTNNIYKKKSKKIDYLNFQRNFLKVPSTPAPLSCNSGDSLISTSSGKVLTATSGSQRDVISSAPSSGDENDESRFICIIRM